MWIRAHKGTEGNEKADALAKAGTLLPTTTAMVPLPAVHLKTLVIQEARSRWEDAWIRYGEARQTKQFYSQSSKLKAKKLLKLGRDREFLNLLICLTDTMILHIIQA